MKILEDKQGNLDDLVVRARKDPAIQQLILDEEKKRIKEAERRKKMEVLSNMKRNEWFDFSHIDERAVELIENVEKVIGFNDDGMILEHSTTTREWCLTDSYLLAFAYGIMGVLPQARELYDKCNRKGPTTLTEFAAAAVAATVNEKVDKHPKLHSSFSATSAWLMQIEKEFYVQEEASFVLYRQDDRADAFLLDNMMIAIAYEFIRDTERAFKIYNGVNLKIQDTVKTSNWDTKLYHRDSSFVHVGIPGNAMAAVYDLMSVKKTKLIADIEKNYGFFEGPEVKFINKLDDKRTARDNITMALAYLSESLTKKHENENN